MLQRIWHFPSCCPASRWLAPNQQENAVAFGEFLEFLKPFEEDQPCIVDERAIAKSASLLDWILNMIRWVCLLVKDILTDLVTFRLQQNSVEQNIRHLQAAELSQGIVVKMDSRLLPHPVMKATFRSPCPFEKVSFVYQSSKDGSTRDLKARQVRRKLGVDTWP